VTRSSQQMDGQTYAFSYTYNLAGGLTSETYPSGRVVTTGNNGDVLVCTPNLRHGK
jgi:YD repeat-containing protein